MSRQDSNLGGLLVGIAAVITAIVGAAALFVNSSKDEPQSPTSPPITQSPRSSALPEPVNSSPSVTPPTSESPLVLGNIIELQKLNEDTRLNRLQAKDVYDGRMATISGFILKNSIQECQIMEESESAAKTTRCMIFLPSPDAQAYYAQTLSFDPNDLSPAVQLNQVLFQSKHPLKMVIKGTIAYQKDGRFQIKDWAIVSYQPFEEPT
jgi:hypothetical protein